MLCRHADESTVKDQYAGDINDYAKYALLRALASGQCGPLTVCWMLTAADGGTHGSLVTYLRQPERYRRIDPELFDRLRDLAPELRGVRAIEEAGLLPRAAFHGLLLDDDADRRVAYFAMLRKGLGDDDLVFFDPDNGLEVQSVRAGSRGSHRYLYWEEALGCVASERSLCIYQHIPRVPRDAYTESLLRRLSADVPTHDVFAVRTSRVAFLVASARSRPLKAAARRLVDRSSGLMTLVTLREAAADSGR